MPPTPRRSDVDACPGALRLHAAADGPLARVRLPGGLVTGAQLAELAALARDFGDHRLELTSRANVQLRALRTADPADLGDRLAAAGLLPSATHETVRNIVAPATAGPSDRELVRELDRALCADPALAALPGRFLFAIGDAPMTADVAAVPAGRSAAVSAGRSAAVPVGKSVGQDVALLIGGVDLGLRVPAAETVPALLTAARAFLAERATEPRPAWRMRDLADGPARVARRTGAALGRDLAPELSTQRPPVPAPIGLVMQDDGLTAAGAAVPLGVLTPAHLDLLAEADRLVVTPWRGVVVPDRTPDEARGWLDRLAAVGLATTDDSRWTGVTACAGRPGCAKSLADVRADADAATRFVPGLPVHWVGCARGCGSPDRPHVRVEATAGGWTVAGTPVGDEDLAELVAAARRNG
ncbi:MAG: precorrin-3B synthase [Actinoplanes sp.]